MSDSLRPQGLQPTRFLCPWKFSGKTTGVGCHLLVQGIFPTQGWNPGLLHCRWILYLLNHLGSLILCCSVTLCDPWTAACQPSLSFTISWSLLKLMLTESAMPSNHLILCRPLLLFSHVSQHHGLSQQVGSSYQVIRVLGFQLQHQSFQ